MNQNQLITAAIQNASVAPSSPVPGQVWFNTSAGGYTANTLYYWNGSAWIEADAQQAVSLTTLQQYVQGLSWKEAVVGASTAALPTVTYANGTAGSGATLTATANAAITLDSSSVSPTVGQRVLIKNQASAFQNGIYTVTTVGSGSVPFVLTRATDMDVAVNGTNYNQYDGATVYVESGTTNAGTAWSSTTVGTVTVGTTNIPFAQLAGPGTITQGTGITVTGNQVAISATYPGQNTIVTVGTITSGAWQSSTAIAVLYGGTGATSASGARTNLSSTSSPLPQMSITSSVSITGGTPTTVTHSLNNSSPQVTVWQGSAIVFVDVASTGVNTITVNTPANQSGLTVVCVG